MTSYIQQNILGASLSSMLSKDKGDISNKMSCATKQGVNNLKFSGGAVLTLGTTGGLMYLAAKKPNEIGKPFAMLTDGVTKLCDKLFKKVKFENGDKLIGKLKSLSPKAKALGAIAAIGLPAFAYIRNKWIYKMGQIDQHYTDKAKLEKHSNAIL